MYKNFIKTMYNFIYKIFLFSWKHLKCELGMCCDHASFTFMRGRNIYNEICKKFSDSHNFPFDIVNCKLNF